VLVYGAFTFACAMGIFLAVKATMGLRVSPEEEIEGLDYGEHGMHAYDFPRESSLMDEVTGGRRPARPAAAPQPGLAHEPS
jgi:Amt family ammonium transporter